MRLPLLFAPLFVVAACSAPPAALPPPPPPALRVGTELRASIDAALRELGPSIQAAIWLGEPGQPPLLAIDADRPMPVASAIKAAYLVELFAAFPDALDAPMPGIDAGLAEAGHPAIAHFTAAQRANAQTALGGATVRRLGEAMITGNGVDNPTYNLAANLVTAHFGGPAALTQRLHARTPDWAGLQVQRYMLADRTTHGDNTATAAALASVHGMLASGEVPNVDPRAIAAARAVLAVRAGAPDAAGQHFRKGGSLDSEPVTRVEAGWHEGPNGKLVHVVMLSQAGVAPDQRAVAGKQLARSAVALERMLLRVLDRAAGD